MNVGDLAFFYASGGKKGRAPGISGIMEVVKEAEPDLSAFDETSHNYVPNPKTRGTQDKPRWYLVHVEFRKKLSVPVSLKELQKYAQGDGVLSQMQEMTAARLSVSKVSEKEWDFIVNELIEGYEEDAALPGVPKANGTTMDTDEVPNGVTSATENNNAFALPTVESDLPTTDTILPAGTAPTSSRPASRARSDKKSTSRPASRAGSLAPPRATSRGRSRTPMSRAGSAKPMAAVAEEGMDVIKE